MQKNGLDLDTGGWQQDLLFFQEGLQPSKNQKGDL